MISTVFQNLASPLTGCMPDIYPGFNGSYWEYGTQDLDMARELLKGAGYGDGFETVLGYNAADATQETTAILFQSALRRSGSASSSRRFRRRRSTTTSPSGSSR